MHAARSYGSGEHALDNIPSIIIVVFLCLALYNVIELFTIIGFTFRRYGGLYFWSFLLATVGVALSCIGFFIKFFGAVSLGYLSCTLSLIGWVFMVTGQSLVLWSRLHLVLMDQKKLKIILYIIIIDAIVCHGTIIPMVYGSFSANPKMWELPYSIAEKMEVIIFFLQEVMLSTFYIIEVSDFTRSGSSLGNKRSSRRLMKHIIVVNVLVILLDITILSLEFANQYDYQISWKPFAYSVKLKLEFTVLNRLVDLAAANRVSSTNQPSYADTITVRLQSFSSDPGVKPSGITHQAVAISSSKSMPPSPMPTGNGIMMASTSSGSGNETLNHDVECACKKLCDEPEIEVTRVFTA